MNEISQRVARRWIKQPGTLMDSSYVESLLLKLDAGNAPTAALRLRSLAKSLQNQVIDPFPADALPGYLRERGVPEDEIGMVLRIRPRQKIVRRLSYLDAVARFEQVTGVSVIRDMSLETDAHAGDAVMSWLKGVQKLKAPAKKVWARMVRKVRLGRPRGSEDASWRHGVLDLAADRSLDPTAAYTFLTHELGHAFEELHRIDATQPPWGLPPYVSAYAESKPHVEDVAESFSAFVNEGPRLRQVAPLKYQVLKVLV